MAGISGRPAVASELSFPKVVIPDPLIALEEAKEQLKITDTLHDAEVSRTVLEAQNAILAYLGKGADPEWTAATLPYSVLAAIKILLTDLYELRNTAGEARAPELTVAAWRRIDELLSIFRDPILA
jgi:hypothetical protein